MAKRNYFIEGGSVTGKSAVWEELQRRSYKAKELGYRPLVPSLYEAATLGLL